MFGLISLIAGIAVSFGGVPAIGVIWALWGVAGLFVGWTTAKKQ
jgi:hypothetical protein